MPFNDAPRFVRGDCDGNGRACTGVNDAVVQLIWLFAGGERPPCIVACDVNANGNAKEIADPIYALSHCFLAGLAPPPPYPDCGRTTPIECMNSAANCAP